jgi:hypothetical protein
MSILMRLHRYASGFKPSVKLPQNHPLGFKPQKSPPPDLDHTQPPNIKPFPTDSRLIPSNPAWFQTMWWVTQMTHPRGTWGNIAEAKKGLRH